MLVYLHQSGIDCDLGGRQSGGSNELESRISWRIVGIRALKVRGDEDLPNKFPGQPEERFFKVIV